MSAPTLGVVILVARGGPVLAEALAAGWADARAVLAADRAPRVTVPAGVRVLHDPSEVETLATDWTLLLREDERLDDGAVAAIRSAIAGARPQSVFALPGITSCLGFRMRRPPTVRLAPRGTRLALGPGLVVQLAADGRAAWPLDVAVERAGPETLDEVVEGLGPEASLVASLLDRDARTLRGILWQPIVAAAGTLAAQAAAGPLGLGRWVLAVLEGYAVVFAYARLWERRHDRAVSFT
jgi:hypothetical protein